MSSSSTDLPSLTDQAKEELLALMAERGYFHNDMEMLEDLPAFAESIEQMKSQQQEQQQYPTLAETDASCEFVSTRDGHYYFSKSEFHQDVVQHLTNFGGRLSLEDAAVSLAVDQLHIQKLCSSPSVTVAGGELVSKNHFNHNVRAKLDATVLLEGKIRLSDAAEQHVHLPSDVTARVVDDCEEATSMVINGVNELVSSKFQNLQRQSILNGFSSITKPALVQSVCQVLDLDSTIVLPLVRQMCANGELPGELHESESSSTGATYVPTIYQSMQRHAVDEVFSANSYITMEQCVKMDIPPSKMGDYVKESFPTATVLPGSVINQDALVGPLQEVIQDSMTRSSFVDLKMHLPLDFTNVADVEVIVNDFILSKLSQGKKKKKQTDAVGTFVVVDDSEALFFSSGMIDHVRKKILPSLIEDYGKSRASEIDTAAQAQSTSNKLLSNDSDDEEGHGRKGKRKGKKGKKTKSKAAVVVGDYGVVPLAAVAKAVAEEYPDLNNVQEAFDGSTDNNMQREPLLWEEDEQNPKSTSSSAGGPLYEFCRATLYTDELKQKSGRAVQAELVRIQESRQAIAVSSRKVGAARVRHIEDAFEQSFPTACHFVQLLAKFIAHASSVDKIDDDKMLDELKIDFLTGYAANFAQRITQYCLFKNEVEDGFFSFGKSKDSTDDDDSDIPVYCRPLNCATENFDEVYLSCLGEGQPEPLPTIRKRLSGNVGVALARMWTLLGGKCYHGGQKTLDNGDVFIRPGDYDGFLQHVENSCLTICGLPFKKLDKKAEKQILFARRQGLTKKLEEATEANQVLDLSVMLLLQQVKGVVVTGMYTSTTGLALLCCEKKISQDVADLIKSLADCIGDSTEVDQDLVEKVKACGLSRDITKHQIL